MKITRNTCENLRAELNTMLPDIEKKLGIAITVGPMRYDDETIKVSLECAAVADGIDISDKNAVAEADFRANAKRYGADPNWFGQKILLNGDIYVITGLNKNARKNCIYIRDTKTGKEYVIDANTAGMCIKTYEVVIEHKGEFKKE